MGRQLTATRKACKVAPAGHLTYAQVAERLGVGSIRAVEQLVAAGELGVYRPTPRCPFIPEGDLEDFVRRKTTQPRRRRVR